MWDASLDFSRNKTYNNDDFIPSAYDKLKNIIYGATSGTYKNCLIDFKKLLLKANDNNCVLNDASNNIEINPIESSNEYENGFVQKNNIFKSVALLKHQLCEQPKLDPLFRSNYLKQITTMDALNVKRSGDGFQVLYAEDKDHVIMTTDLLMFLHQQLSSNLKL
jgi:hypothetical protein